MNITVKVKIHTNIKKVWEMWTEAKHIKNWYFASDYWYVPEATSNLRVGGKFKTTMSAKNKSTSFDFEGTYTQVKLYRSIEYIIKGGRHVKIGFISKGENTTVIETFEVETTHTLEQQRSGWQAILNNFKKYVESSK